MCVFFYSLTTEQKAGPRWQDLELCDKSQLAQPVSLFQKFVPPVSPRQQGCPDPGLKPAISYKSGRRGQSREWSRRPEKAMVINKKAGFTA